MIGDDVFFNTSVSITAQLPMRIGNGTLFGEGVKVYDHDHVFDNEGIPLRESGFKSASVSIGSNCWICTNAVVLRGSTIGDNSVVAAGAVVKGEVPPNTLYLGIGEMRPIRYYIRECKQTGHGRIS